MPAEDALKLAWESGTQAIREDWKAGRKTQAAGRGVTAVLSVVLGGKGATTLGRRAGQLTRPGRLATKSGSVLNKVGREYPSVLDPRTGAPIPYPGGGLSKVPVSEQVAWGAKERGAYIKEWYDRGYATPEGGWSGYDVHHIRPREYGGTNDFGNLVPVPRTVHQQEFNTWWQNY